MALKKRGKYRYGDNHADIRAEILRYSKNEYLAEHFADATCACGAKVFRLLLDDGTAAVRKCSACQLEHPIGDSDEYLEEAELSECACPCGGEEFEISIGISLYRDSEDVRWLYIGCRCPTCGLTAVYGDWKNECDDYQNFLKRV
jgi:hypothetical protein